VLLATSYLLAIFHFFDSISQVPHSAGFCAQCAPQITTNVHSWTGQAHFQVETGHGFQQEKGGEKSERRHKPTIFAPRPPSPRPSAPPACLHSPTLLAMEAAWPSKGICILLLLVGREDKPFHLQEVQKQHKEGALIKEGQRGAQAHDSSGSCAIACCCCVLYCCFLYNC